MVFLYGRARRLAAKNGVFWPGQCTEHDAQLAPFCADACGAGLVSFAPPHNPSYNPIFPQECEGQLASFGPT